MVGFGHSSKMGFTGSRLPGRREDCRVKRKQKVSIRPLAALVCLLSPLALSAAWSGKLTDELFSPHQRKHWAFQKVQRPVVPAVRHSDWVRTPIDAFVLAKLEARGLDPSPPADRVTLLRRAYFDLIGLPPMPEDVDAFLADQSSKALGRVVDRLLDSPHYGERWTRHWLDLARYADSEGFKSDQTRPNAWRYREYLIRSFNGDKPYNRFVREQIAGDELWSNDPDAGLATAFNRLYPDEHNARNLVQRRQEILHDITSVVGGVFLGLTYECARCHDHKFDPLLQADYYRLQAFFANVRARDDIVLASRETADRHRRQLAAWEEETAPDPPGNGGPRRTQAQGNPRRIDCKISGCNQGGDLEPHREPDALPVADVLQDAGVFGPGFLSLSRTDPVCGQPTEGRGEETLEGAQVTAR